MNRNDRKRKINTSPAPTRAIFQLDVHAWNLRETFLSLHTMAFEVEKAGT